jgi:tetratricopeptide (TPR) repeat protein
MNAKAGGASAPASRRPIRERADHPGALAPGDGTVNSSALAAEREQNVHLAFQAAIRLDRDGRWRDAEQCYRSILAVAPNHIGALDRLGALYARTGKLEDALTLLRRAVDADARGIDVRLRLGAVLLWLKRPADAQVAYHQALALRGDCADAHCGLGHALRAQNRTADAIAHYQRAIAIRLDFADAHRGLGHALMAFNRPEQARVHYRAVLALRPDDVAMHSHLGNASVLLNRFGDAIAHYEKAAATAAGGAGSAAILACLKGVIASTQPGTHAPDSAKAHRDLGLLLLALRRPEEASVQWRHALTLAPDDADTLRDLADLLQTLNRHHEAIAHYHKALAIRPGDATTLLHLANGLEQQGQFTEAVAYYERVLAINPDDADGHGHLGNALFALKRPEAAIAHYQAALVLAPGRAEFHNNLGIALQALGDIEEACGAYQRALQAAPRHAAVHLNLANAKPFTIGDPRLCALEALAQDLSALAEAEQIALHFALGKAFADLKAPERAFRHWLAGNALKRRTIAYDEAATLGLFQRIRATFTGELMAQKRGGGMPSPAPVFVVGMPRSGTTLIEQILASHSKVFGAGELEAFPVGVADVLKETTPETIAAVSHETLRRLGERYLCALARTAAPTASPTERVVDKLPTNFLSLGLIHLALPNARIIHVCRDPVDTCLSCFSMLFAGPMPYSYELGEIGRYYRAYAELVAHWRSVLPPGVMIDVHYEEVVSDLEAQARRMVAHCGLAWEDACLAFHQTRRLVRTASATQVRQPLYRSAIGRWRPYRRLLGPLWQTLGRAAD